jgi:hypothetical protein
MQSELFECILVQILQILQQNIDPLERNDLPEIPEDRELFAIFMSPLLSLSQGHRPVHSPA